LLCLCGWLLAVLLAVISIIRGVVEGNATYILWGTLLAVVSALFMKESLKRLSKIATAAAAKLVIKMVRRALRKELGKS